jgi:flagellar biosynthesis chaperone FliJ
METKINELRKEVEKLKAESSDILFTIQNMQEKLWQLIKEQEEIISSLRMKRAPNDI